MKLYNVLPTGTRAHPRGYINARTVPWYSMPAGSRLWCCAMILVWMLERTHFIRIIFNTNTLVLYSEYGETGRSLPFLKCFPFYKRAVEIFLFFEFLAEKPAAGRQQVLWACVPWLVTNARQTRHTCRSKTFGRIGWAQTSNHNPCEMSTDVTAVPRGYRLLCAGGLVFLHACTTPTFKFAWVYDVAY
jgi:hypothetical protein